MEMSQIELFSHLSNKRWVDLSLPYNEDVRGFSSKVTVKSDRLNSHRYEIYSHAGTHVDAPYHYGVNNKTIGDYDASRFMGRAWVVRLRPIRPRTILRVKHLGALVKKIKPGDSILFDSGWSRFISMPKYRDELPRIGTELAKWCVAKKINLIGVEPPSVADVNNTEETSLIHNILLGGNVLIIEGLANLDQIENELVWLMAFPLNIEHGDGSPSRVLVID